MLEALTEFLTARGYEVVTLENARDATTLLAVTPVDVVLLDVAMPGTDGATALRRIRESHPSLPVILVAGNPDLELARDTLKCGAFDYVAKPFDFAHLADVVEAAVTRRR
jgi:two-component system, NtrC family, response regulator AtoC